MTVYPCPYLRKGDHSDSKRRKHWGELTTDPAIVITIWLHHFYVKMKIACQLSIPTLQIFFSKGSLNHFWNFGGFWVKIAPNSRLTTWMKSRTDPFFSPTLIAWFYFFSKIPVLVNRLCINYQTVVFEDV